MTQRPRSTHVPRQARSRLTVTRLLAAAGELFPEQGFAATTTNQIAARAGVSVGSLYQFFADKSAMLNSLQLEWAGRLGVALDQALNDVANQELADMVDHVLRVQASLNADPPGLLGWLLTATGPAPVRRTVRGAVEQRVEELLTVRGRDLSPAKVRVVAKMVIHISTGVYALGDLSGVRDPEIFRQTRQALLAYLTPLVQPPSGADRPL